MATAGFIGDREGSAALRVRQEAPGHARVALGAMFGRSPAMERLFLQMRQLASHLRVATLEGERGSGKRLAAGTLHGLAHAGSQPFLAVEAAEYLATPDTAAPCAGGTLYLAGVDALDAAGQLSLLRLLDRVRRAAPALVSPAQPAPPRTLLVSARRPLRALTIYGQFRADLLQQLSLVKLLLPPLRERREDLRPLAEMFATEAARARGRATPVFTPQALLAMEAHAWPGNVAELRALLGAAVERAGSQLEPEHLGLPRPGTIPARYARLRPVPGGRLPAAAAPAGPATPERGFGACLVEQFPPRVTAPSTPQLAPVVPPVDDLNLDRAILRHIHRALARVNGNKLQAARLLGISRSTIYRLLEGDSQGSPAHRAAAAPR